MDIAVVDDEKAFRDYLCGLLRRQRPESRIAAYASGEELLAAGRRFDIIFLDIRMDGISGVEAARRLRKSQEDVVLIFITALKKYVFEAFDLYATGEANSNANANSDGSASEKKLHRRLRTNIREQLKSKLVPG